MQVAYYARVSTNQQQHEGTIESQRGVLNTTFNSRTGSCSRSMNIAMMASALGWIARPLTCVMRLGVEFDAVVIVARSARRNYAHQWLLIEEFTKMHTQVIFLHNPFGDSPQGKLLTQMQGMIAEYERAQITERTRRGRLEKARRGEFMPWAYQCYGYRYLPKRHGCAAQVMIEPAEADVVRAIYRALVEEQLSCRQITKRLNASHTATPTGKNHVWQWPRSATSSPIGSMPGRRVTIIDRLSSHSIVRPQNTNYGRSRQGVAIAQRAHGYGAKHQRLSPSSCLTKPNGNCDGMWPPHARCTSQLQDGICSGPSSNAASAGSAWSASGTSAPVKNTTTSTMSATCATDRRPADEVSRHTRSRGAPRCSSLASPGAVALESERDPTAASDLGSRQTTDPLRT